MHEFKLYQEVPRWKDGPEMEALRAGTTTDGRKI